MAALTITQNVLINSATRRQIQYTVLTPATPTQASNTILYDPTASPFSTAGAYVGTKIRGVKVASSTQGASGTQASCYLTFDASTPVVACSIPCNSAFSYHSSDKDMSSAIIPNSGGSGVTGKIGLTTNGLVAGDTITIILDIING